MHSGLSSGSSFWLGVLLSISCDACVKFLSCRKSLQNISSAYKVDFEFLTTTPAGMQRVQSVASQLHASRCGTHFDTSCLHSMIERAT